MSLAHIEQGGSTRAGALGGRAPPCEQLDHRRLTANLTANRSDSCRSIATAAYEPEPLAAQMDSGGRRWTPGEELEVRQSAIHG
jgi:hypothetical protein